MVLLWFYLQGQSVVQKKTKNGQAAGLTASCSGERAATVTARGLLRLCVQCACRCVALSSHFTSKKKKKKSTAWVCSLAVRVGLSTAQLAKA